MDEVVEAIKFMRVRGAPLIGVTGAYGIAIALTQNSSDQSLIEAKHQLIKSRPTAVNLSWAVNLMSDQLKKEPRNIEQQWLGYLPINLQMRILKLIKV